MRSARFEVVRSDAGWFARFVAANGRKVWQTEVYTRDERAWRAVEVFARTLGCFLWRDDAGGGVEAMSVDIEVREVDERSTEYVGDLNDAQALGAWALSQKPVAKAPTKIHAIAALRKLTGASLYQAKTAIEARP